jgi:hypothetical protein
MNGQGDYHNNLLGVIIYTLQSGTLGSVCVREGERVRDINKPFIKIKINLFHCFFIKYQYTRSFIYFILCHTLSGLNLLIKTTMITQVSLVSRLLVIGQLRACVN